mgnify:CR=1 FL=1
MKTLSDFIHKKIENVINIHDGLLSDHFYMEFNIFDNPFNHINEKYGAYNGQIDFIKAIASVLSNDLNKGNKISYNIKKEDLEEAGFENIFFKEININVSDEYKETAFIDNVKFDSEQKLFDSITINIKKEDAGENLLSYLVHELTHAWEEYGRHINNSPIKLKDLINKDSKYYDTVFNKDNQSEIEQGFKNLLYHLNKFEANAFISELSTVLEKDNIKIKDYNDALKHFKESDTWKRYELILNTLENFDEEYQERFKNYYNKINNTSLTFNKIQKKLLNQCKKIFNKISTVIPKIYYDWYTKNKVNESISQTVYMKYSILEESLNQDKRLDKKLEKIIDKVLY